ncbi:MAG: Na/Pi cotransporter family protein [Firmicutes bacterium]|nr:Na/Pi cotransporter family protein [Bacillota bacterium]
MNVDVFQILITLFGGLALFIYGMNLMSDGLQKTAGEKMEKVLGILTRNPIMGVLAGALCTAVLQSSSATTVMVLGFVSAGLMGLPQAISVIFGANIGTTITAQLIAFKIGDYAWLFLFIGFVMFFFLKKKEKIMDLGQTIMGFGMLFVGINIMGDTMKPLAEAPVFVDLMMQVQDIPVLGVVLGAVMTVVVQSSSATIAVLQNLASTAGPDGVTSILGLAGALPILFGDNIGTTITAVMASIGGSIASKRTAAAHVIFNLTGTLVFIWFIPWYAQFIEMISPAGPEIEVISRQIANAHMCFNIANTIIWLPLIGILVKVVTKLIPGKDLDRLPSEPVFLDNNVLDRPFAAIMLVKKEMHRLAEFAFAMIDTAKTAFVGNDTDAANKVLEDEENVDILQSKIVNYLSDIFTNESLTEQQAKEVAGLMHVATDIEHIGDYCENIAEYAIDKNKKKYEFSEDAYEEISGGFAHVKKMVRDSIDALKSGSHEAALDVKELEADMNRMEAQLRKQHMIRLNERACSPEFTVIYNDIIHNLEKIGDSCDNMAETVLSGVDMKAAE